MLSGVLIALSSRGAQESPSTVSNRHSTAEEIYAVDTALLTSAMRFAPKKRAATTEQPMLHPKAKAMKTRVIS